MIAYYEYGGDSLVPGDYVTIKAELYKSGIRINDSLEIKILAISGVSGSSVPISMIDDGNGVFSYQLTISANYHGNYFYLEVGALIADSVVDSDYLVLNLIDEERDGLAQPLNSVSQQVATPGDTIEVLTYIPDIESGTINFDEATVTVDFQIMSYYYYFFESTMVNSMYLDDGFFLAAYTIPAEMNLTLDQYLFLSIYITTEYSGEEFHDSFWVHIGGLKILTKFSVDNNSLILDALVLGKNLTPHENVSLKARLTCYNFDFEEQESLIVTLPNTNSSGRSTYRIKIDKTKIKEILGVINASKDNVCTQEDFYFIFRENYGYNYFYVSHSSEFFRTLLESSEKEFCLDFSAHLGSKVLANVEIDVYVNWRQGLIDFYTIETDEEGYFNVEINWPDEFRSSSSVIKHIASSSDIMRIDFAYYNGSTWFKFEFQAFKLLFNPVGESDPLPVVYCTNYSDYQVVTVTFQLPSSIKMGSLSVKPLYEGSFSLYPIQEFSYIDNGYITENGSLYTQFIIDKSLAFEYAVIEVLLPDSSFETGYKALYWLIDNKSMHVYKPGKVTDSLAFYNVFAETAQFVNRILIPCVIFAGIMTWLIALRIKTRKD